MRWLLIILAVFAVVGGAFVYFGGIERVTAANVSKTLQNKGVPVVLADCMGERMASRLSISQLRALQRMQAQDDETAVPLSRRELIERLQRVDDPEAVEVTIRAAAGCSLGLPL